MQNNNETKPPIMNANLEKIGTDTVKALNEAKQQVTIIDDSTNGLASGAITGISGSSGVFKFAYINLGTSVKQALEESGANYCIKLSTEGEQQVISITSKDHAANDSKAILEYQFTGSQQDIAEKTVCTALACMNHRVTNPDMSTENRLKVYQAIADSQNVVMYKSHSFENQAAAEMKQKLAEQGLTIATVESITCGLAGRALGAAKTYGTYSNHAKNQHVGVNQDTMDDYHEVSVHTAEEMAIGGLKKSGNDICMSFTGFAGEAWIENKKFKINAYETEEQKQNRKNSAMPAPKYIEHGQVCIAVAYKDNETNTVRCKIIKEQFGKDSNFNDRHAIRDAVITRGAALVGEVYQNVLQEKGVERKRSNSVSHKAPKSLDSNLNRIDPKKNWRESVLSKNQASAINR